MHPTLKQRFNIFREKLFAEITSVPGVLQPAYFPGLDGLRAIAIIIVLLGHLLIGRWWVNYFPGVIGVDIFFVISGFLITTLLIKEKIKTGNISLTRFYIRRCLRIFPVAYLYLVCLIILNFIFNLHTTLRMFLTAGLYIGNFPVHYGSNWQTAHFWSLAVEEQFYLLFPFILARSVNKYLLIITIILVLLPFIVVVGILPLKIYDNNIVHKFFLSFRYLLGDGISSILIGSLTSILVFKRIITFESKKHYFLSFIIFSIAIGLHMNGVLNWNVLIYIFPLLISYVIVLNLTNKNFFSLILNHPVSVKIGILSYSIYIWQQLFTYDQPWQKLFKYSDSLVLNCTALFVVAYFSYTFYESKFLKFKKHFKKG